MVHLCGVWSQHTDPHWPQCTGTLFCIVSGPGPARASHAGTDELTVDLHQG